LSGKGEGGLSGATDYGTSDDHDAHGTVIDRYPPVRDAYARLIERLPAHGGHPPASREDKAEALLSPAPAPEQGSAALLEAIRSLD
jgi:hypothetical protein